MPISEYRDEKNSFEVREFWRERNLRILFEETTMKSTETIIDQVNIVQDEASDVLILEAAVVLTASSSDNDAFTFGDKDMELFTNRYQAMKDNKKWKLICENYNPLVDFTYEQGPFAGIGTKSINNHTRFTGSWFRINAWRTLDIAFSDIPFALFVGQKAGIATRERKNRSRTLSNVGPMKRKAIGRRGDGYVRDWAASEARPKWKGEQGTELINECCLTLPKIMKDIFINLSRKINFEEDKGYVCRYMKEGPFEIYADAKQCNNTLNALVSIIYAKTMGKFEEMEKSTEN
ncbi:hypothetical protein GLOIN_2v1767249 [Rhizophagus irregularis DAOM 181602=DAOM 197198]|uniref:Uncharacterized protein n=1 Tax=Rhizophagus irregularis (strain DAOM 181602 / DAOM 197198 / MUCL 43194) TaxID=747089 RepID=A0A2P4QK04_RHIID|nr:hypothetical protein GLOIN_2v1767249 [Rhizophagus irregularis DAOM 181602=DAOM 197198]POG77928.1 hypothetical protein GLOIN_2v1767249 [Rhizophagus irregularis DAOM 181602=DAOM 197198]|eukprot:XP_025184794.1 hypothetical protein GLOIN_2v1767249 [Rhizophagus irregularis DAOM 181602=DAOM 197198]